VEGYAIELIFQNRPLPTKAMLSANAPQQNCYHRDELCDDHCPTYHERWHGDR
jgi:hypothetical protein